MAGGVICSGNGLFLSTLFAIYLEHSRRKKNNQTKDTVSLNKILLEVLLDSKSECPIESRMLSLWKIRVMLRKGG